MAQDFIALIEGRADLSSAQKAFDAFKKQVQQPIKITFDTGGLNTTFNAINKQAEQQGAQMASAYARGFQGNIRGAKLSSSLETILYKGGKLDLGDAGILNVNRSALKELEALPGVYKAIEKELDSIGVKGTQLKSLNFNDTGTSFTAKLSNGLNTTITLAGTLTAKMNEAGEAVGQWVTTQSYMTDFTNSEKQAQAEAEKLATSLQKVKDAFTANDSFSSTFKSMESELANIGSTVSTDTIQRATQAAEQYKSIIQEIQATLNGTATNPLSDAQVVEKYKEAQMALTQYKNVMTEVRIEQKSMITEAKANQNADAVQKWCNNNSKALKKYGAELEDIQQKMRTTFDAKGQAELQQQAKQIFAKAGAEGLLGKSFGDEIKRAFTRIGEFTGIYYVTSKLRQVPQQMVSEVIKIDTAMTELRKVSTASASEISDYFDRATDSAYKYGQAINEVIDSTASWTRLGYNLEDASILTDVTAELAKVGAGLNTDTATEGLQAIIRGYGFAADEAKRVADTVNEVSDTSPIDALGIIQGLERSSATLRETNNSLEESIGLITATTSVTQDATSAGTAWRTVALRIAGAKNELEEAGLETDGMVESTAKLRDEILAVAGVDILDATGKNFKSTYQIMEELSKVWKDLDQIQRNGLLDKIAGFT